MLLGFTFSAKLLCIAMHLDFKWEVLNREGGGKVMPWSGKGNFGHTEGGPLLLAWEQKLYPSSRLSASYTLLSRVSFALLKLLYIAETCVFILKRISLP